jgi:hypothetical protein
MKNFLIAFLMGFISIAAIAQDTRGNAKELRHMVLFTFKATSTKVQIDSVVAAFGDLYGKVPQVKKFEWGMNISTEHFDQGFTHCFLLTFKSEKDLADYQLNPLHKQFQAILKPHMDKVFVVDYWAQQAQKDFY